MKVQDLFKKININMLKDKNKKGTKQLKLWKNIQQILKIMKINILQIIIYKIKEK